MSVQPASAQPYYHTHLPQTQSMEHHQHLPHHQQHHHIQTNGSHPDPRFSSSAYTNGHHFGGDDGGSSGGGGGSGGRSGSVTAADMHPYSQSNAYPSQYAYQQQQQQRYAPSQFQQPTLPPLGPPGMGATATTMSMGAVPGSLPASYGSTPGAYAPQYPGYGAAVGSQLPPPPPTNHPLGPPSGQLSHPAPEVMPPIKLSHSGMDDKYIYTLVVDQQPQRARMCGFGDKDRRPITPPPCVRLVVKDRTTGKAVDFSEIQGSFFVLQVDLWDDKALREVNIVRASSNAPAMSISNASTTSYPPQPDGTVMVSDPYGVHAVDSMGYPSHYPPQRASIGHQQYMLSHQAYPGVPPPAASQGYPGQQAAGAMFTRNLIGSLTVNAARLKDPDGKESYWFVLQDLSVRTEGFFRLKMNFIDVGSPNQGLNRGRAPVLAWVFSEPFQVYSAKKFPGVIESTALSKKFASQGIKIPVRKDAKGESRNDDDDDD